MSLIIDLIVVGIILLFTFLGYKRGFVKLAFHLCTFFIAIILAFMLYKPVSSVVMEKTNIDESIQNKIWQKAPAFGHSSTQITDTTWTDDYIIDHDLSLFDNLPDFVLKNCGNTIESISKNMSKTIIEIACFLIIFIIAKIALMFVTFLANLIAKLPILNQINKLGGTLYGIIEGLLIVFVGFAIISLIAPLFDTSILESINSSTIGAILYNNNILLKLIM